MRITQVACIDSNSTAVQETDLRDAVLLLGNLIHKVTGEHILSHHFFQAKLNKSGKCLITTFWKVLHKLLCRENCTCKRSDVNCVKTELAILRYTSLFFYSLPVDESYGSRDLLLALSWLVANGNFDSIVERKIFCSSITQEFPESNIAVNGTEVFKSTTFENAMNHLAMCAGKIKRKCYNIDELRSERDHLINKVHEKTSEIPGVEYLSVNECLLFSNGGEGADDYLAKMNDSCEIAEAHLLWLKKRNFYLKWIFSVTKEKREDPAEQQVLSNYSSSLDNFLEELTKNTQEKDNGDDILMLHTGLTKGLLHLNKMVQRRCKIIDVNESIARLINKLEEQGKVTLRCIPKSSTANCNS